MICSECGVNNPRGYNQCAKCYLKEQEDLIRLVRLEEYEETLKQIQFLEDLLEEPVVLSGALYNLRVKYAKLVRENKKEKEEVKENE